MKLSILQLVLLVLAVSHVLADVPPPPFGEGREGEPKRECPLRAFYNRHVQCRGCLSDENDQPMKWCAAPGVSSDSNGQCVTMDTICDDGHKELQQVELCPSDAAESKLSCTLCTMDGYSWCQDGDHPYDEYAGSCMKTVDIIADDDSESIDDDESAIGHDDDESDDEDDEDDDHRRPGGDDDDHEHEGRRHHHHDGPHHGRHGRPPRWGGQGRHPIWMMNRLSTLRRQSATRNLLQLSSESSSTVPPVPSSSESVPPPPSSSESVPPPPPSSSSSEPVPSSSSEFSSGSDSSDGDDSSWDGELVPGRDDGDREPRPSESGSSSLSTSSSSSSSSSDSKPTPIPKPAAGTCSARRIITRYNQCAPLKMLHGRGSMWGGHHHRRHHGVGLVFPLLALFIGACCLRRRCKRRQAAANGQPVVPSVSSAGYPGNVAVAIPSNTTTTNNKTPPPVIAMPVVIATPAVPAPVASAPIVYSHDPQPSYITPVVAAPSRGATLVEMRTFPSAATEEEGASMYPRIGSNGYSRVVDSE